MNKLTLTYIGRDIANRPVYKDENSKFYVDTNPFTEFEPCIFTKRGNKFDCEPDELVENTKFEFVPKRIASL